MSDWITRGTSTQFPGVRDSSQNLDVVIGFDFGTACTKIILRTPYADNKRAWAIHFAEVAHHTSPYFLPSMLRLSPDGWFSLGKGSEGALYRDIKRHLVNSKPVSPQGTGGEPIAPETLAVAFLALALRKARAWFLESKKERHGRSRIAWHFNVGMPSADYDDLNLCATYKRVSHAAWWLSIQRRSANVTVGAAEQALRECDLSRTSTEIHEIPEVAAEAVGYAESHLRENGLHVMVDIGASTLDICGFILGQPDGDNQYSLLTGDVQPFGTIELYENRVSAVDKTMISHVLQLRSDFDPANPIPNRPHLFFPTHRAFNTAFEQADKQYLEKCSRRLSKTIMNLKMLRCAGEPQWTQGAPLPVFLCGGGSAIPRYKHMIQEEDEFVRRYTQNSQGIDLRLLPKPEQLETDVEDEMYHRLAVASGLSYPRIAIGDIKRPQEIPHLPRPKPPDTPTDRQRDW